MSQTIKIAIVGAGPRGLALTEALLSEAKDNGTDVAIHLFDPNEQFGAGPNFDPKESDLSLLNLPAYDVDVDGNTGESFSSFYQQNAGSVEDYPPRSVLGNWLESRFSKISGQVTKTVSKVSSIEKSDDGWKITTENGKSDDFTHVILAVAQPETAPDRAMARWLSHAEKGSADLRHVYPSRALGEAAKKWAGKSVAVRGFALSCLDALRQLTLAQGGEFTADGYRASGREPKEIYIFSDDGLSLHPKPLTKELDERFDVTEEERDAFVSAAESALSSEPKDAIHVLFNAMHQPATRILESFEAAPRSEAINTWLNQEVKQPGSQYDVELTELMANSEAMARGEKAPDVGYVLGQIWRKFQDDLSAIFDKTENIPDETRQNLISFDDGFKRYSYGPPVQTFSELRKLIDAGLVKPDFIKSPTVSMTDNGWKLKSSDHEVEVEAMVDAVLEPCSLAAVVDEAVAGLREEGHLSPNPLGGATITTKGQVVDKSGNPVQGLYLMGRLANGSVLGVDSIRHCFGEGTQRVASALLSQDTETEE